MTKEASRRQGGFFYGWWIVIAVAVGLFMGFVPVVGFTFSVFFVPIAGEFNWSRAEISLAFSLSLLVLSVCLPITGRLVDRFGARRIILTSVVLFGLTVASFYFLSANLWHYYAIYIVMGIVGSGITPVPYYNVITRWFDKRRGLALGLSMIGVGLSEIFMPSFSQALISRLGWREAYVVIGVMVAAVTFPVVGLFLKERPQQMGLLPDGEMEPASDTRQDSRSLLGLTRREAWRTGTFWLMSTGLFLVSMSLTGCLVHMVPLLKDRGISAASAALAISILGGANLLGRVFTGYLLDRFFAVYVALGFFCGAALGIFILLTGGSGELAFLAAFLIGIGMGAESDIMAYLVGRYFGLRAFGEIYGYILAIYTFGAMIGPLVMGFNFDLKGSYQMALIAFAVVTLLGAALMAQLGPYREWKMAESGAS